MLVTISNNDAPHEIGLDKDKPYFIYAIKVVNDGEHRGKWYLVYNERVMSTPSFYPQDIFTVVDHKVEDNWITKQTEQDVITSFPEFANDRYFYNYLLEDDWKPEKTKWARQIVATKYAQYTNNYAITEYGSINEAKKHILQKRYEDKLKLHQERGYEKPEDLEITDELLDQVVLDINDLYSERR